MAWITRVAAKARHFAHDGFYFVAFLDEINTTNAMSLFKEILIDRSVKGMPLPANLRLVAACNPYRLKKHSQEEDRMAGLIFDQYESIYR